jgi:hypothetical protein
MKRDKIIAQLESELVASYASLADADVAYSDGERPAFYDGYWTGRIFGLRQSLTLLHGKELKDGK